MAWCLNPILADKFKRGLIDGTFNPEILNKMTSEERRGLFEKSFGKENARQLNQEFESKLLLKNRQLGMIRWAEKGLGFKAGIKRDLIMKIRKLETVLSPEEERDFLADLVAKKMGVDISFEEAKKITELSKAISEAEKDTSTFEKRIAYGNKILDLIDYTDKITTTKRTLPGLIVDIANIPRSVVSSIDFSAPFRQGFGYVGTKEWRKAWSPMFKSAFSKQAYRDVLADIYTRPNYDLMRSGGLRINKLSTKLSEREEAFASSLADLIPGVAGSGRAYTAFLDRLRADTFDKMVETAKANGEDISRGSATIKSIAKVVNQLTGTGDIGKDSNIPLFLNALFFSPRKIASTVNLFNPYYYYKLEKRQRIEALKRLFLTAGMSFLILQLGKLFGGETEDDPRSADFGKLKFGDTRIDVTGGNGNYITLLSRIITGKKKSSTTDLLTDLGTGYNAPTRWSLTLDWLQNKLSPLASYVAGLMGGKDSIYEKFDPKEEAVGLVTPMVIGNLIESVKNDPQNAVLGVLADIFGMGVNVYSTDVDWKASSSKELKQFRELRGDQTFNEANEKFNQEVRKQIDSVKKNKKYQALSDAEKAQYLSDMKSKIKDQIFRQYKFSYRQEKAKPKPKIKI